MKQYPYVEINFNGTVFKLFVNGKKYAVTDTTELLSYCINTAIEDYWEENGIEELKVEADKLGYRLTPKQPLEELRAKVNEQGYTLVKKQPYVPFPACKCTNYRKGITRFRDGHGYYYRCPMCKLSSKPAKLVRDAMQNWYDLTVEVYGRNEVKRK